MKISNMVLSIVLGLAFTTAFAQQAQTIASGAPQAEPAWQYKTKKLDRAELDALLSKPGKVLVIDVRRPDEVSVKGSFPVYLSIQAKDVEKNLAYIPKGRTIVTLSNHAHRAGAAGDILSAKGFKVAGAAGSEDYEAQGGLITRISVPVVNTASAAIQK